MTTLKQFVQNSECSLIKAHQICISMNVAWYVTQQFHMSLDDICFNIGAEIPLLGSTVLYSSKTIEEKPTIAFVTDLLASEQLSAVMLA